MKARARYLQPIGVAYLFEVPDDTMIGERYWFGERLVEVTGLGDGNLIREAGVLTERLRRAGEPLSDPGARDVGPYARGSDTSRRAALDNYPRAGTQRWKIIHALAMADGNDEGCTRSGLQRTLGLPDSSVDPRVLELITGGWVKETEREARTRTGSMAKVLELTPRAIEQVLRNNESTNR